MHRKRIKEMMELARAKSRNNEKPFRKRLCFDDGEPDNKCKSAFKY
jgi:hypothetical protein